MNNIVLVRNRAGSYRTEDSRFNVTKHEGSWVVYDTRRQTEFGFDLIVRHSAANLRACRTSIYNYLCTLGGEQRCY
jgi:hypothetical protein